MDNHPPPTYVLQAGDTRSRKTRERRSNKDKDCCGVAQENVMEK